MCEKMSEKLNKTEKVNKEIEIPVELIDRIDKIIKSGKLNYYSKEKFIEGAVIKKLEELKNVQLKRSLDGR